jgi:hypothetical protein
VAPRPAPGPLAELGGDIARWGLALAPLGGEIARPLSGTPKEVTAAALTPVAMGLLNPAGGLTAAGFDGGPLKAMELTEAAIGDTVTSYWQPA